MTYKNDLPKSLSNFDITLEEYNNMEYVTKGRWTYARRTNSTEAKKAADYWFGISEEPIHNFTKIARLLGISSPTAAHHIRLTIYYIENYCEFKLEQEEEKLLQEKKQEALVYLQKYCAHIKLIHQYSLVAHELTKLGWKKPKKQVSSWLRQEYERIMASSKNTIKEKIK